ncbi:MAG: PD-(D/E)XK nuclease family protein, partial [Nitrospirota bacterium]
MKKGIVFIAPLGARNKKAAIFNEIVSQCPDNDYSSVLYITPAAFSESEVKKQFFSYLKSADKEAGYIPFRSFTLTNFCMNLYETVNPPIPPLSKGGEGGFAIISDRIEPLIFCELIGGKNIGYARNLSGLLSKIRHHILGRELSQVREDIKSLIFEEKTMKRAVKAIEFLELYEKELKGKGLIDFGGVIRDSAVLIKEHLKPSITVLDGFFDPTPLELEVIKTLIDKSGRIYALVDENAEFWSFFQTNGSDFERKKLKSFHSRDNAVYYTYPSMEDEVQGIARGVKGLIIEGVKPNEITVSFPLLSKYTPMLRRNFRKHGIPVSIAEYDISVSRQIMVIEDMIASIEDDYPRNEFISFLTSVHLPKIPAVIKEFAIPLSNRAGIIKGKKAWLAVKETILDSTEEIISDGEKKILDEFQGQLKHIISTLDKLRQEKSLTLFIDAVEAILYRFGFFDSPEEPLAAQAGDGVLEAVARILSELKQFAGLYSLDDIGFGDASFYFRQMLKGLKGGDRNAVGVRVVPFETAAGIESRALFFGGMTENDLPSKPAIDPILPEKVKKGIGLPYLEYYLNRQKRYFHRLLNVSSSDPYFSCPSADGDKIFLPSPFLDWNQAVSPPCLNISTEEDILIGEGAALNLKNETGAETHYGAKATGILRRRIGAMSKRYFRVTDLDYYRKCPFRFYLEKILGLEVEKPPRFEVEYRQWGTLAHRTMEH